MPGFAVTSPAVRAGLFGKLPSHGDFVARGFDTTARDAWDAFTSAGLAQARETLGAAAFEAAHDTAPPWRLVAGPGNFGPGWRAGALAPSLDAAGRRYVVVLAAEPLSEARAAAEGEALAAALEDLIWDGFAAGWDADGFLAAAEAVVARAAQAEPEPEAAAPAQERWWTAGAADHSPQSLTGRPADLWLRILAPSGGRPVA